MEPIKQNTIADTSSATPVSYKENQLNKIASPSTCFSVQQENITLQFIVS